MPDRDDHRGKSQTCSLWHWHQARQLHLQAGVHTIHPNPLPPHPKPSTRDPKTETANSSPQTATGCPFAVRGEDDSGKPTQSHIPPSTLVYEEKTINTNPEPGGLSPILGRGPARSARSVRRGSRRVKMGYRTLNPNP